MNQLEKGTRRPTRSLARPPSPPPLQSVTRSCPTRFWQALGGSSCFPSFRIQHPLPHRNCPASPPLLFIFFPSSHNTPSHCPIAKLGIVVAKHSHFQQSHFCPTPPNESHTGKLCSDHVSARATAPVASESHHGATVQAAVARRRRHASWAYPTCACACACAPFSLFMFTHLNLIADAPTRQNHSKSVAMAREGTRSATGSSKPRVFQQVDTAPTIKRKPAAKKAGVKPTGVTKKTAAPKKESSVVTKVRRCWMPARQGGMTPPAASFN